jgi:hypothetical protein
LSKQFNGVVGMCKEFGQTCADEQENCRTLLQIYHERSNQLANIIHASNGLIITILVGVLAFAGSVKNIQQNPSFITILIVIVVISLIAWRAFAHNVDNEIIQIYGKILCCEYRLNVPLRTSLLLSLINKFPEAVNKKYLNELKEGNKVMLYSKMFALIKDRNVGDRGHRRLDLYALVLSLVLIIGGSLTILFPNIDTSFFYFGIGFIIGGLFGCLIAIVIEYPSLKLAKIPE